MNITLKGYKGKLGGAGVIAMSIGKAAYDFYQGQPVDVQAMFTGIFTGLGILGIRIAMD